MDEALKEIERVYDTEGYDAVHYGYWFEYVTESE
jgi:hypothetical protein